MAGHAHHGGESDRVAPADAAPAYVHGLSAPAGSFSEDLRESSARSGSGAEDAAVMVRSGSRRRKPWKGTCTAMEEVVAVSRGGEARLW
jgi:hypothetical protein